jgi:hypothetical protein
MEISPGEFSQFRSAPNISFGEAYRFQFLLSGIIDIWGMDNGLFQLNFGIIREIKPVVAQFPRKVPGLAFQFNGERNRRNFSREANGALSASLEKLPIHDFGKIIV